MFCVNSLRQRDTNHYSGSEDGPECGCSRDFLLSDLEGPSPQGLSKVVLLREDHGTLRRTLDDNDEEDEVTKAVSQCGGGEARDPEQIESRCGAARSVSLPRFTTQVEGVRC